MKLRNRREPLRLLVTNQVGFDLIIMLLSLLRRRILFVCGTITVKLSYLAV